MGEQRLIHLILRLSMTLFALSLTTKSYCTITTCSDSIMVFLLGWAAAFSGGAGLSWIANPLLFAAWLTLKNKLKLSMFLSVGAGLISLSFLLFDSILDNENGNHHQIISYQPGYWLWVSSNLCMLLGTFILMLRYITRKFNS